MGLLHPRPSGLRPGARAAAAGSGVLSGLLLAASTAQIGLGLLVFVALVPLLARVDSCPRIGEAAAAAGLGGLIFFGCALCWIPATGLASGSAVTLLCVYIVVLASAWALLGAALAWIRARDRAAFFLSAPVLWIALEYARAQGPLGYPWHHLGYALADFSDLLQLAAYGGVYALSLWIVASNTALASVRRGGWRARAAACVVLLAPLALAGRGVPGNGETISVTAIQPAARAPANGVRATFDSHVRKLVELTDAAVEDGATDLVVWPESAYEALIPAAGDPFLGSLALHYERPLLLGARRQAAGGGFYNSAVLARPDGTTRIAGDKVHPVPVLERAPVLKLERWLQRLGIWRGRFQPAPRAGVVQTPAGMVGVLICLDSSYPELARDLHRRGARLLVEISNEAQSGGWTARQHARVSRLRAVETGLPLVRVSNSGPTEWVDARGHVQQQIAPGAVGWENATLELTDSITPFVRFGPAPTFVAGLIPLIPLALRRRRTRLRAANTPRISPIRRPAMSLVSKTLMLAALVFTIAAPAVAMDGSTMSMGGGGGGDPIAAAEASIAAPATSYYEDLLAANPAEDFQSTESGLPTTLAISDSTGTATYTEDSDGETSAWTIEIRDLNRPHEHVDAVYQVIAVIPLPFAADGSPGFTGAATRIQPREGSEGSSVPMIYGGEKVVLKRNVALEKMLLPGILGASESSDKLPSLQGTGYDYTLWDTIVSYDEEYGNTIQVFADVAYSTEAGVSAPDAADERLKAYVLTWIPGMDPSQAIYTVRIDVQEVLD